MSRIVRRTTLLVVGEGPSDKAFLDHMKVCLNIRELGRSVTVEAGDGGSPGNVINNSIRKNSSKEFDKKVVILDSDVQITRRDRTLADQNDYDILQWSPVCLEWSLLEVLSERVGNETCRALKNRLERLVAGKLTDKKSYEKRFTCKVLEETQQSSVRDVRDILLGRTAPTG